MGRSSDSSSLLVREVEPSVADGCWVGDGVGVSAMTGSVADKDAVEDAYYLGIAACKHRVPFTGKQAGRQAERERERARASARRGGGDSKSKRGGGKRHTFFLSFTFLYISASDFSEAER